MNEVIKKLVTDIYRFVIALPLYLRALCLVALFVTMFFSARCGVGGESARTMLWNIVPMETFFDCPRSTLVASLTLEVLDEGSNQYRSIRQGQSYPPGTQIRLIANASRPCWLIVFSVDSSKFYQIMPRESVNAIRFDASKPLSPIEFKLNEIKGREIYSVVVSDYRFSYDEIRTFAEQASLGALGRGPDLSAPFNFPKIFSYVSTTFINSGS